MLHFIVNLLDNFEHKTLQNRNGQWLVCVLKFIGKTEINVKSIVHYAV